MDNNEQSVSICHLQAIYKDSDAVVLLSTAPAHSSPDQEFTADAMHTGKYPDARMMAVHRTE